MIRYPFAIVALRYVWKEEYLTLRCGRCQTTHERLVNAAFLALRIGCGACGAVGQLEPETTIAAMTRLQPPPADADAVDREMAALVRHWHEDPELADALDIGLPENAGAFAEHPLQAIVLDALLAAP